MLFTGKNNREYESPILIRRDELGISMKELCEKVGVRPATIYNLAYGSTWPVYVVSWNGKASGEVKPYVARLCDVLSIDIEDLFPMFFCKIRQQQDVNAELFMSQHTLQISRDPADIAWENEMFEMTIGEIQKTRWGGNIQKKHDIFMMYFYDDYSYEEIGEMFGMSRANIAIICRRILRMLKHPSRKTYALYQEYEGFFESDIDVPRGIPYRKIFLKGKRYFKVLPQTTDVEA